MTCATYRVPLDWDDPAGETIELGMARLAAKDPENRIGYLFINPGGPGNQASGSVSITARRPTRLAADILNRFDIIGLDPRGVGLSTPIQCDNATFNKRVNYFAKNQQEFDELLAYNKAVGESCQAKSGRLLGFMDTISTAKDIEAVRLALGGEKANFAGLSYGSQLYATYAQMYPDGFRAMLLDGLLQHSQGEAANLLIESSAFEAALRLFFDWCHSDKTCPLYGQDVQEQFLRAVGSARDGPVPAPACDNTSCRSDVSEEELYYNIQQALESTDDWPTLAQGLMETINGNATLFSTELQTGDVYHDSVLYAERAVLCQDWTHATKSLSDIQRKQILGATFTPLVKGHTMTYKLQTYCLGWPTALRNPPAPFRYNGSTPILLSNAIYDPATGYAWATGMAGEISNSVLLSRNGSGHTSFYRIGGETAAAEAAYLLNLTLPQPGTVYST